MTRRKHGHKRVAAALRSVPSPTPERDPEAGLPAWARRDWRPLQPGEQQIDDVTPAPDHLATAHGRMVALCRSFGWAVDWKGHRIG